MSGVREREGDAETARENKANSLQPAAIAGMLQQVAAALGSTPPEPETYTLGTTRNRGTERPAAPHASRIHAANRVRGELRAHERHRRGYFYPARAPSHFGSHSAAW